MAMNFPANPADGDTVTGPNGAVWSWDGEKWVFGVSPLAPPLMVAFSFPGLPAVSQQSNLVTALEFVIPANFTGSAFYAGTAASAAVSFTISQVVSGVNTIIGSVTSAGVFSGAGGTLAVGDVLRVTAPAAQDATLADVAISILAARV